MESTPSHSSDQPFQIPMANLPEHVIELIVEMASDDPVSWEDAVIEGSLRIVRFLDFGEQRILATLDRTARRTVQFAKRVAWEPSHPFHGFCWS